MPFAMSPNILEMLRRKQGLPQGGMPFGGSGIQQFPWGPIKGPQNTIQPVPGSGDWQTGGPFGNQQGGMPGMGGSGPMGFPNPLSQFRPYMSGSNPMGRPSGLPSMGGNSPARRKFGMGLIRQY